MTLDSDCFVVGCRLVRCYDVGISSFTKVSSYNMIDDRGVFSIPPSISGVWAISRRSSKFSLICGPSFVTWFWIGTIHAAVEGVVC